LPPLKWISLQLSQHPYSEFCCSKRTNSACCFPRCSGCLRQSHSFTALAEPYL
jgi:hypothetical protein